MIVSVLEWNCPRCQKMHQRRMFPVPPHAYVISVASYLDPNTEIGPMQSIPTDSGHVYYKLMAPADLSCTGKDWS